MGDWMQGPHPDINFVIDRPQDEAVEKTRLANAMQGSPGWGWRV